MKMKNLSGEIAVYTSTKDETKELLTIVRESGYIITHANKDWRKSVPFLKKGGICLHIAENGFAGLGIMDGYQNDGFRIIEFDRFKQMYCESNDTKEKRNISISLSEARKLFNSGDAAMKALVLSSFTEKELKETDFNDIKTFEDACEVLLSKNHILRLEQSENLGGFCWPIAQQMKAIFKLDIIRKALNDNWKPSLSNISIYYPCIRLFTTDKWEHIQKMNPDWKICKSFLFGGIKHLLVGGDYDVALLDETSRVDINLGILGCKSPEIAKHMSIYFTKEIFEACYAQHGELCTIRN